MVMMTIFLKTIAFHILLVVANSDVAGAATTAATEVETHFDMIHADATDEMQRQQQQREAGRYFSPPKTSIEEGGYFRPPLKKFEIQRRHGVPPHFFEGIGAADAAEENKPPLAREEPRREKRWSGGGALSPTPLLVLNEEYGEQEREQRGHDESEQEVSGEYFPWY
jgi:hypothetical protein